MLNFVTAPPLPWERIEVRGILFFISSRRACQRNWRSLAKHHQLPVAFDQSQDLSY
jgi:hypothetical protein